jgi:hypothetical protein
VCYVVGEPQRQSRPARRPPAGNGDPSVGRKIANVVSFVEGYPLKEGAMFRSI